MISFHAITIFAPIVTVFYKIFDKAQLAIDQK